MENEFHQTSEHLVCAEHTDLRRIRTNPDFGLLSFKRLKIPFLLDLAWPILLAFMERIFFEDREIVEMEQAAWKDVGGNYNQEVFPVINQLRDLLRRCAQVPDGAGKAVP